MKNKKVIICLIALMLVFTFYGAAAAGEVPGREKSIDKALDYLGSVQNDDGGFPYKEGRESSRALTCWAVMAIEAAGGDITGDKWISGGESPVDYLKNCRTSPESINDISRTLLAWTAAGQGVTYNGANLVEKITSRQQENGHFGELINTHMWSVLALASAGVEIPNKEKARNWLLEQQNSDGGFGWAQGVASDADDTAVAVQSLVILGDDPQSSSAIDKALVYLREQQQNDGGFSSGWTNKESNSATCSWVLQALYAAGEDPLSDEWLEGGNDAVSYLISLQDREGYINWKPGSASSPVKMTAYAAMALSQKPFPVNKSYSRPGKSETVSVGKFSDLPSGYWARDSIKELVNNNVLSGYPSAVFKPEKLVTRAEFTKFMVYGLGCQDIKSDAAGRFTDVPGSAWYNNVVSVAVEKGYVKGVSKNTFEPNGKITGAELATMLVRALPHDRKGDVKSGPHWYSASVNLAEKNGLLYPDFYAQKPATRAQCAYSIVQLREITGVN